MPELLTIETASAYALACEAQWYDPSDVDAVPPTLSVVSAAFANDPQFDGAAHVRVLTANADWYVWIENINGAPRLYGEC